MRRLKQWGMLLWVMILAMVFVQAAGSYVAKELNRLEPTEHQSELYIQEKVVKQNVLKLTPREYYTVQIGSYPDITDGQEIVDALALLGYRVFVSDGPPYQLWLGCLGAAPDSKALPNEIIAIGSDIFVQKQILNQLNFQFPAEDTTQWQDVAVLIASLDVVIGHSLQMFQDYRYEACSVDNWNSMIHQVQEELALIASSGDRVLGYMKEEQSAGMLLDILTVINRYHESLGLIEEKQSTKVVLLTQSCLMELIDCYHDFIQQNSVNNE